MPSDAEVRPRGSNVVLRRVLQEVLEAREGTGRLLHLVENKEGASRLDGLAGLHPKRRDNPTRVEVPVITNEAGSLR